MSPAALPDGYTARTATFGDAEAVAELIAACQRAVGDRSGMTVEELLDDWQEITLSEDAVAVEGPDERVASLVERLELPRRLREVGVPEADLEEIARDFGDDAEDALTILRAAY